MASEVSASTLKQNERKVRTRPSICSLHTILERFPWFKIFCLSYAEIFFQSLLQDNCWICLTSFHSIRRYTLMYFFDVEEEELYHFMRHHGWTSTSFVFKQKSLSWYTCNFALFLHMEKSVTFIAPAQTGVKVNCRHTNTIQNTDISSALSLPLHLCKTQNGFFQCLLNQLLCWCILVLLYWLQWDYANIHWQRVLHHV